MASRRSIHCALALVLCHVAIGLAGCGDLTTGGVFSVAYRPDGTLVALGNDAAYVLDADARSELRSFPAPAVFSWIPVPSQTALSSDGRVLAIGNGRVVDTYDVESGVRHARIPVYDAPEERAPIAGVALSHDGTLLAVAVRPQYYGAPRLGIWTVADQSLVADAQVPTERKYWQWGAGLAFSVDGQTLYALLSDVRLDGPRTTYVTAWDTRDGNRRAENPIPSDVESDVAAYANLLALSPDGTTLATSGTELRRWDAATLTLFADFPAPTAFGGNSLAFAPDGRDLVTTRGSNEGPDPQIVGPDGALVRSWPISESIGCESAQFSPDGTRIAAACGQYLRIWEVATGSRIQARKITGEVY